MSGGRFWKVTGGQALRDEERPSAGLEVPG